MRSMLLIIFLSVSFYRNLFINGKKRQKFPLVNGHVGGVEQIVRGRISAGLLKKAV